MKKEKFVEMNTHDLQKLVITLIEYSCNKKNFVGDPIVGEPIITEDDCDKLIHIFSELNRYCYEGNDYTITLEVHH